MNAHKTEHFIAWLEAAIDAINQCESRGRAAATQGDDAAYASAMREKAETLVALRDEARPYLEAMDDHAARDHAVRVLENFAYNAGRAIELDSVFYMSALLFSEAHQPGEPHNLELFRAEMIRRLGL